MKAKKLVPLMLAAALGVSVLAGCGNTIDGEKTGATLDGEEISLGFMNFMARYQQAVYDGSYMPYFGTDMWSQDLFGEGSDMETSVKSQVAENVETLYLLEKHMADYKVEITEDELAEMDKAAEQFMEDNTDAAIKQVGATKEYVKEMLRLNTIQVKMREAMDAEVDTEVSDEEAAQKTFSYVKVSSTSTTDEDGETVEYTDEEKEALKAEVEEFASNAKDDFEGAAETAGYTVSTYSYGADEDSFEEAVIEAADELKDDEISGVITTDESYYVVHMDSTFDEEKTESKKQEIIEERQSDHYTEVCDGYKEDVKFELNEDEWAKVKFDDLFTIKQEETTDTEDTDTETTDDNADSEDNAESDSEDNTDSEDNAESDGADSADDAESDSEE